ncbi:MAG: hypothetical protein ABJF01_11100 [bacterium]
MATPTPYRSLSPERRIALVTHAVKSSREGRALWLQRLAARSGFRVVTLQTWSPDRIAKEIVRTNAETATGELDLLHLLYVEVEPAIQITFLDVAGVAHEKGAMDDQLQVPYADADAVRRAAGVVKTQHGDDGMRYLRTLARYSPDGWPGIGEVTGELEDAAS